MKKIILFSLLVLSVFIVGCEELEEYTVPNVSIYYREALLDDSLVAVIRNNGEDLYNVYASIGKVYSRYLVAGVLRRGETIEVGWLELGYGLKNGDLFQIYANGYSIPYEISVRFNN